MIQHQTNCLLLCGALLVSLAGGCGYSYKEVDADGDGYFLNGEEPDCWDAVEGPTGSGLGGADIHPGSADAWYDGVDANCDGVDDFDQDGDGIRCNDDRTGDEAGCTLDCNDQDAAVNPGVAEACTDGVDNDCDGLVDTDDVDDGDGTQDLFESTSFYLDVDSDGYGDDNSAEVTQESCTAPAGYAVNGGDCDDDQAAIHPGAEERCDGVDQDCDGDARDPDSVNASTWYLDGDGDGYGVETDTTAACDLPDGYAEESGDCDDDAAGVNPGADEICDDDDVDEDCDGEADDADPDGFLEETGTRAYPDGDGDGFGDEGDDGLVFCDATGPYVLDHTDCDDSAADVNPDAAEVCDSSGVDEDCANGANDADPGTDPDTMSTYYLDDDDDGYGGDDTMLRCKAGDGYVGNSRDCDDGDEDRYPGADEVCGDGVVSDCDLSEDEARETCILDASSSDDADLLKHTSTSGDKLGATLAAAGDTDGDGLMDLVAVATGSDSARGRAYVILGSTSLTSGSLTSSYTSVYGTKANDALGSAASGGGDVDGDGYDDLILGSVVQDDGASNAGAAYLIEGPLSGASTVDSARATQLRGDSASLEVGASVLLADLDGDDKADMVVGATGYDNGSKANAGAVYVLFGAPTAGAVTATAADLTLTGDKSGDGAGSALAAPGDINGDGVGDLAIGVSGNNDSATDAGKVWVLFGLVDAAGALSTEADYTIRGVATDDLAGTSLAAAGDVDGDGYADLLVGAPSATSGAGRGSVYVVAGDADIAGSLGLASAAAVISATTDGDALGTSMAGGFDLDGDDLSDLLLGAPGADSGGAGSGTAWLLLSPVSGAVTLATAGVAITGDASGDALGTAVLSAGDMNGDDWPDLVLGAPTYDYSGSASTGAVYLFTTWY